jgi:hypothetical protein
MDVTPDPAHYPGTGVKLLPDYAVYRGQSIVMPLSSWTMSNYGDMRKPGTSLALTMQSTD